MRSTLPGLSRAAAEALESRQLLSSVSLDSGTLTVTGDPNSSNRIVVSLRRPSIQLTLNGKTRYFPLASVQAIHILGGAASDVLTVNAGIKLPTQIDGLGGNDKITGSAQPGIITTGQGSSIISPGVGLNYIDLSIGSNILYLPTGSTTAKTLADTVIVNSTTVIKNRTPYTLVYPAGSGPNAPLMPWDQVIATPALIATPTLTATASATDPRVIKVSRLSDTVTLFGGNNPTGTLTFILTAPDGSIADSETVPVTGQGAYSTANPVTANLAGTYTWTASYSGDNSNSPASSPPQTLAITQATPTLPTPPLATTPLLIPGTGFTEPTTVPPVVAEGFAASELAMSRWDVVPYQTFNSTLNVGVVAFHINGIARVDFSVNGGPWASVTQASLNPTTNVVEYFAQLDASKFANGTTAEVRAIAYPTLGIPRVLNSVFFIATPTPAATQTVYVSKSGSDTNDGSLAHPFLTLSMALYSVNPGGTIQIQDAGTYSIAGMDWYNKTSTTWTTIRQNPNLAPNSVIMSQGSASTLLRPFVPLLHWQGIAFDFHGIAQYYVENGGYVWFDTCTFFDSVGWIDFGGSGLSPVRQQASIGGDFATDCTVHDAGFGFVDFSLVRSSHCYNISGDVFTLSSLVVNCTVDNVQLVVQGNHNDLSQYWANAPANTVDNIIVYGVTATNIDGVQDIFLVPNTNESFQNMAFVNYSVQNNATTLNTNFFSQFSGVLKNILLQNLNLPNQPLLFRTDLGLQATDVVIDGSTVNGIFNQTSGGATQQLPAGVTVR